MSFFYKIFKLQVAKYYSWANKFMKDKQYIHKLVQPHDTSHSLF